MEAFAETEELTPQLLRRALGAFATGVAVIGARGPDGVLVGMTANSFTSVSLHPPLVLFCAARSLSAFDVYSSASHFSANVLPVHGEAMSDHFARPCSAKWRTVPHAIGTTGVPLLDFAIVSFECQVVTRHEAGDHLIVIGQAVRLRMADGGEPLVFFRSRYRQLDVTTMPVEPQADLPFLVWG